MPVLDLGVGAQKACTWRVLRSCFRSSQRRANWQKQSSRLSNTTRVNASANATWKWQIIVAEAKDIALRLLQAALCYVVHEWRDGNRAFRHDPIVEPSQWNRSADSSMQDARASREVSARLP